MSLDFGSSRFSGNDHEPSDSVLNLERQALAQVDSSLQAGLELKRWWDERAADDYRFADRFETVCTHNRPDESFAFFDSAPTGDGPLAVMGDLQNLFFDRVRSPLVPETTEGMAQQLRRFALRYFMRVSDSRSPTAFVPEAQPELPPLARPFSWCPQARSDRKGFGYEQLYFKRREDGQVGRFDETDRFAVIDVRELLDKYEWVVLKVRIFDFDLEFAPFGSQFPSFKLPLREKQLVILHRDFLVDRENPEPGVLGEYGFGYAVLPVPDPDAILAYGPGHFDAGFQLFHFRLLDTGEVRARLVFVVNRPEKLLNIPLDPMFWARQMASTLPFGDRMQKLVPSNPMPFEMPSVDPVLGTVDLLDTVTSGLSARELCIQKEQLEKDMLVKHFVQNYELILGSQFTWRQIPDWLDTENLPEWVRTGRGR